MNENSRFPIISTIGLTVSGLTSLVEYWNVRAGFDYGIYHNITDVVNRDPKDLMIGGCAIVATILFGLNVVEGLKNYPGMNLPKVLLFAAGVSGLVYEIGFNNALSATSAPENSGLIACGSFAMLILSVSGTLFNRE